MKEQDIVRQILDGLKARNIFAFRLNTGAFSGVHKGKKWFMRTHTLGLGAADIFALTHPADDGNGTSLMWFVPTWIEVKNEKGQQSLEQQNFQNFVESLGHKYVLARSFMDVEKLVGG